MRKLLLFTTTAIVLATLVIYRWQAAPLEEHLVRIQAESEFPDFLRVAENDLPIEVLATLVDYRDDKVLLLKAQAAVVRYPALARELFPKYGQEPEFREVLRTYGEAILLPIGYFVRHEVRSVAVAHYLEAKATGARAAVDTAKNSVSRWRRSESTSEAQKERKTDVTVVSSGAEKAMEEAARKGRPLALTPDERGWHAVNFIHHEGYDFLGQFATDTSGQPIWTQTERFLEGLNSLLASGVRSLETKYRSDQQIEAADLGWAAVDALVVVGATSLLRFGKAASVATRGGKSASAAARSSAYASRVAKATGVVFRSAKFAKWPTIVGASVVILKHPSLLNSALAGLAEALNLPRWLVQGAGWTILLLPMFYLGAWIVRLLLIPVSGILRHVESGRGYAPRKKPVATPA